MNFVRRQEFQQHKFIRTQLASYNIVLTFIQRYLDVKDVMDVVSTAVCLLGSFFIVKESELNINPFYLLVGTVPKKD